MLKIIMRVAACWVSLIAIAATTSPTLPELRQAFETAMRDTLKQQQAQLQPLRQSYTTALSKLEGERQEQGAIQEMIAIRYEKARFEQVLEIPTNALVAEPLALRKLQDEWNRQGLQLQQVHARQIVNLSEKYMQALASLQKSMTTQHDDAGVDAVKAETARLLNNNIILESLALVKAVKPAVETTPKLPPPVVVPPLTTSTTLGDYKFYPPGKETVIKDLRDLHLDFPSAEYRGAAYCYALTAKIYFDKSKVQVTKRGDWEGASKEESGQILSIPRVTVTCRNKDVPEGAKLVIQYFSHPTTHTTDLHEERVEHIALPPLARGQAIIVDGQGVLLYKYEYRSVYSSRGRSGHEFYGLIVSMFDAENKLLIQECAPSSLAKSCQANLPEEKDQPPTHGQ